MFHFCHFLCFLLNEYYFLYFFECLLSFTCILAHPRTILVLLSISLLSHAWNCFLRAVVDSVTRLTHMHVVPFSEYYIHCLHAWSFTPTNTQYRHAFTFTFSLSCSSTGLGSLGLGSASPRQHCAILRGKDLSSSQEMCISSQWLSSSLALHNYEGQWLLAQKIAQCSH